MKMKILALALMFAAAVLPGISQEQRDHVTFKGNWVGMSLAEWKANPTNASDIYVNFGDPAAWRRDRKKDRHIQGPWCSDSGVFLPTYLDTMTPGDVLCTVAVTQAIGTAEVGAAVVSNLKYDFRDGKLIEISFSYDSMSYRSVLDAFEAKYGKSAAGDASHYENGFGATWTGENRLWKLGDVSIVVSEGSGNGPGRAAGLGVALISGPARQVTTQANVNF